MSDVNGGRPTVLDGGKARDGLVWQDRLWALRDRLLADPRFQRWVATFPLTRRVASRHARAAFDICAGFVYSQVLAACVQLRLFESLADGPKTAAELAVSAAMPVAAMERLLVAAAALRLVARRSGGRWGLGATGAAIAGSPGLSQMIAHHALLYADLADPVALLRGQGAETHIARYWPYAEGSDPARLGNASVAQYSQLMAQSQGMIARDIVDAYPLARHRSLLDIGGGEGMFLAEVAVHAPALKLALFDLPSVAARATTALAARGLAARVAIHGGDFFDTQLPACADVISLIRILHDHNDDAVLRLLQKIHAALPSGGALLIAEPMAGTPGAETVGDTYFGFYLLAMGRGRARTPAELGGLLRAAGFSRSVALKTARPMLTSAMVATA